MKRTLSVGALCVAGTFALATAGLAQDTSTTQSTTQSTTIQSSAPVSGRVVRYEAGKSIVVVGSDGRQQTFQLTSATSVPSDVAVGRSVSIVTEPSASGSGSAVVTRITTTSVGSDGSMKTETQTHVTDPSANVSSANPSSANPSSSWETASPMSSGQSTSQSTTTQTTTTTNDGSVTGTVSAYEPGKSVTFVLPDKRTVVYTLDASSVVPSDIAVGKTYSVTTVKSTTGSNGMTVKKITTTTTKTTTNP
jgi:hypothetical protein